MVLILGSFCGGDSDTGENWNCRDRRKSGNGGENVGRGRLHVAVGLHGTSARRVSGAVKQSVDFLVLSGLATGLSWLCYFHALQIGPASRVAPIDKLSVALVILFGALFLGEQLTCAKGVTIALE